jgi:hypothetical protein
VASIFNAALTEIGTNERPAVIVTASYLETNELALTYMLVASSEAPRCMIQSIIRVIGARGIKCNPSSEPRNFAAYSIPVDEAWSKRHTNSGVR